MDAGMDEPKEEVNNGPMPRQDGVNWKPGMQVMGDVSTWIVVPIVLALIFGKMLDARYGTEPVIFLSLTGFAFIVTCYGIYRAVKKYIKK